MFAIHAIINTFHHYPDIAIYLTLAVGFWAGRLKFGSFSLGTVTTTLIAGLIIGQMNVPIPHVLQSTFFAMFLFAVGFSVGPQFIRAIRSDGLPQVFFAIIVCISGLATAWVLGHMLGYNNALTAGLLSGGYTNSTVLGVANNLIANSGMSKEKIAELLALLPVAYAVTYPFGTAGSAWVLGTLAPKLFGFNLPEVCRDYERKHGKTGDLGTTAYRNLIARAYKITSSSAANKTVREIEQLCDGQIFIRRVRHDGEIIETQGDTLIHNHDTIIASGSMDNLLKFESLLGEEVHDSQLLEFRTEELEVVVQNSQFIGQPLSALRTQLMSEPGRGLFIKGVSRDDAALTQDDPILAKGDVIRLLGAFQDVKKIAKQIGNIAAKGNKTDVSFMGFGIVIGSLLGAITIHIAGIPLSFGTSVGAIVAGIACGYIHNKKRSYGQIPSAAIWVFNNIGLNGFIAIVGLNAAPRFISGLEHYGVMLFIAGILVTCIPLFVGLILGHFVFKFHPGILVGACAGARSTTAALGAVVDACDSNVPVLGYTIGYAVSRVVMALLTVVVINFF
ncbi:aspartate-alanine antiporter [Celerinatantimonas sp. MCCC 1A17872]|uniref:aspartate-alanine antiporter n=1 Tax=Celerinatantimonas sp. MCCC 1A17872 TaxID=3177514 RepID=UPI0038C4F910